MKRIEPAPPWLILAGGDFIYKGTMAVYWVLLARSMSLGDLGVVALANAIAIPAFVIIDAGLNAILVRDYSEVGGLPKSHRRRVIHRLTLSVLMLGPLGGLGYLLGGSVEAAVATGLMSMAYFCDFAGQLMLAPSRAASRMEPDALVRIVQAAGTVGITVVFIFFGKTSPAWIAFASTVAYACAVLPARRVWRRSQRWATHPDAGHKGTRDEAAVSQATILMSAFGRADSILVQIILGPVALAGYTVAYKLIEVARLLPGALSRIILARSSDATAASYNPGRHLKVSLIVSAISTVAILLFASLALRVLFGSSYQEESSLTAQIMGLSIIPYALVVAGTMYAIGIGRGATYRRIAIESLFVLLVTVTVLADRMGLEGAALGMLISQIYSGIRFWNVIRSPDRARILQ